MSRAISGVGRLLVLYVYFISLNHFFFIYLLFVYRSHPVAIECITLAVGLWDKQMSYSIFTLSPPLLSFFTTPLFTLSSSCLILPTTWGKWTKNKTYGQLWDFRLLQHIIRSEVIVLPYIMFVIFFSTWHIFGYNFSPHKKRVNCDKTDFTVKQRKSLINWFSNKTG